jgi:predicted Na+-dependent transporter
MKKYFILFIFAAIILGLIFPFGDKVKFIMPFLLSTLLFFNFFELKFELKNFFKIEILYNLIFVLGLLPIAVFFLSQSLSMPFRIGLFLIAITPTAIGSSIMVKMLGGDISYAIASTVFYNFLSIISYPFLLHLYFGNSIAKIPVIDILLNLVMILFIPFIIAIILKQIDVLKKYISKASKISNYLFIFIIYIAVSSSALNLRKTNPGELAIVALFTLGIAVIYFATGFLLGKNFEYRKTLASCMGQKNTGLCIWVSLANFTPLVAVPATIYIIVHHLINALLLALFAKKT